MSKKLIIIGGGKRASALYQQIDDKLTLILHQLRTVHTDHLALRRLILASVADFQAEFDRIDVATSDIAAELQDLRDQLVGGISAGDADALVAGLDTKIAALEAMGHGPVPPAP